LSRAAAIRAWLAANPGWHFAGDVADGVGAIGSARDAVSRTLWNLVHHGHVRDAGRHGTKRYALGRTARKYERKKAA